MKSKQNDLIIDAVITWVDGNDEKWQQKINKYSEVKIDWKNKKETVRYNSIDEIAIAIKSIIKYASFVRNIFLVTDNQIPDSFSKLKELSSKTGINLVVIDHKIIFKDFETLLPCFNSCSIGSMLFRIPNLSEHFLIFNDDTFLMRNTKVSDFFKDGYPIVRGKWKKYYEHQVFRKMYYRVLPFFGVNKKEKVSGFKRFQQTSAKLAGMPKYIRRFHTPVSLRKSTLENFFDGNETLENNVKYRFRNENQFIISSLSNHLEMKNKTFYYEKDSQLSYFRSYKKPFMVRLKLFWFSFNKRKLFMCFQSLETADKKTLNYILNWIDVRLN